MKRWVFSFIALCVLWFAATPAFAQVPDTGDTVCFGGSRFVESGSSPDSVLLFGCGGRISEGARVRRDVVSFGGNVIVESGAQVGRDLVVFGGNVNIAGTVTRRVTVFGGRLTLEPTAVVQGDLQMFGGQLDRRTGAVVRGRVTSGAPGARVGSPVPFYYDGFDAVGGFISGIVRGLITALALAALGALLLVFMPAQTEQVRITAAQSALPSLGVGCLTWLVAPALIVLFVITCLGIPLGLILGILLVAALAMGWIAISMYLGDRLLQAFKTVTVTPVASLIVGLLVLWLLTELPILGGLIGLFVSSLALGAVVLTFFGTRPYPPETMVTGLMPPAAPVAPVAAGMATMPGAAAATDVATTSTAVPPTPGSTPPLAAQADSPAPSEPAAFPAAPTEPEAPDRTASGTD